VVSTAELLVLGGIAGFTIYLGLPIGRVRDPSMPLRAFLNAAAIGILLFLLWDVLSKGYEPVSAALDAAAHHGGSWWRFGSRTAVFGGAIAVGLLSLGYYDRWLGHRRRRHRIGPGAAVAASMHVNVVTRRTDAQRLALFIALGIGFHNLSEGLAIGQSAAKGEISLAVLLIIGFGLHNATEGFGIIGPMAADGEVPSWGFLGVLGLIGGGPTLLGTLIGDSFQNNTLFLGFLALAAGSILYVVIELLGVARKLGHSELLTWGILVGLVAGFGTDMVLTAAGV
jgi:zinc transporter, ZIP family